jgi:hypothetical protein
VDSGSEADDDEELTEEQLLELLEENDHDDDTLLNQQFDNAEMSDYYAWTADYETFSGVRERFDRDVGPTIEGTSPSGLFTQLWDESLMQSIAMETNKYAWTNIALASESQQGIPDRSRLHDWIETSSSELYRFIAVLILMAMCLRGQIEEYWSKGILGMPGFRELMSKNRYLLLNKFLHFVDNDSILDRGAQRKLAKIKPLLDFLNEKFRAVYSPRRELSLDESLLLWKGRLSWVQCIRTKAARFGIKSYELCEGITGYVLNINVYTGKDNTVTGPLAGFTNATSKIVITLAKEYLNKGHTLFMDNFYNSVRLSRFLKLNKTDVVGTLNRRRLDTPVDIRTLNDKRMPRGTVVSRHCGDISVTSWKDVKLVTTVSTYHNADVVEGRRAGVTVMKPVVVEEYNSFMGGVDMKDQKLSMYLLERKRGLKWYMKVFKRLLNITILNSYIIYCSNIGQQRKMTHRQFRYQLAQELAQQFGTDVRTRPNNIANLNARLNKDLDHFPEHVAVDGERTAKQERFKRMRCIRCAAFKKQTKTNVICKGCKVFLCIGQCWSDYHTLENI